MYNRIDGFILPSMYVFDVFHWKFETNYFEGVFSVFYSFYLITDFFKKFAKDVE